MRAYSAQVPWPKDRQQNIGEHTQLRELRMATIVSIGSGKGGVGKERHCRQFGHAIG